MNQHSWRGMGTLVRATCPECGDVELGLEDVTVVLFAALPEGSYAFQCPECRGAIAKPAQSRVIELLLNAGARLTLCDLPAELDEPRHGAAISYDDVLDFHFQLQRDDWFDDVTALIAGAPTCGRHPGAHR